MSGVRGPPQFKRELREFGLKFFNELKGTNQMGHMEPNLRFFEDLVDFGQILAFPKN